LPDYIGNVIQMIGRSALFTDLMCPDDEACWRPHCHFWHSKDEMVQESSNNMALQAQPFVGYMGYVDKNDDLKQHNSSMSNDNNQKTSAHQPDQSNHQQQRKRNTSPLAEITKPKKLIELSVDEILDPKNERPDSQNNDTSKQKSVTKDEHSLEKALNIGEILQKGVNLNDHAKSVADIDTRIQELQRQLEEEKRIRERVVDEIKAKVKHEYVPTTKKDEHHAAPSSSSQHVQHQNHRSSVSKSKSYSGGYTPTPLAVLKAEKANAKEKRQENERTKDINEDREKLENGRSKDRERAKEKEARKKMRLDEKRSLKQRKVVCPDSLLGTSSKKPSCSKLKSTENLSIDDLFDGNESDDEVCFVYLFVTVLFDSGHIMFVPPPKKLMRTAQGESRRVSTDSISTSTEQRVSDTAKRRIVESSIRQATSEMRISAPKTKVRNVSQQLNDRYERLQKEKEAIMKKLEKSTKETKGSEETKEDIYDYRAGSSAATVEKGEKRVAHTVNVSYENGHSKIKKSAATLKLMPLDPYAPSKVPYAIRTKYLTLFHTECTKFCASQDDAIRMAQQEEKSLKDRAITKGGYATAAVHVLKRLREMIPSCSNSAPTSSGVKSVSHEAMLHGRHGDTITIGARRCMPSGSKILSETWVLFEGVREHYVDHLRTFSWVFIGVVVYCSEFYAALKTKYVLTKEQLELNGYPVWEDEARTQVKIVTSERDNKKKLFADENDLKRVCCRCGAEFRLTPKGEYVVKEQCVHHWARAFKTKVKGTWESRYACCSSDLTVKGCCIADYHVTDTALKSDLSTFRETPPSSGKDDKRSSKVFALDCEMVYTPYGLSLARISVVDMKDELVLDVLVRQKHKIVDCNTRFSGLTEDQIQDAECDLQKAQDRLFELVNSESILIGHSLESDLKAMRIVHNNVVDTSIVYPHRLGLPFKRALKTIAAEVLQLIIQEDVSGHDSKEDSSACMRLMLNKVKHD
uniref:Putative rnase h (inferred by orthology to a S. mansoni protein) n=1 Tax=Anisakis simplex TaxID=6269 RepID=A0A158PMQ5_ANISI